jgi:hypothetical protein
MFRKVIIALLATAALGMLAPGVVSARGGGGGGHGGFGGFHGSFGGGGFHRGDGFGRGGFHAARFGHRRAEFRFEHFRHTGPIAERMTGSRRQVMHCITSDCRISHSYADGSDENRHKPNARPRRHHDELKSDHLDAD